MNWPFNICETELSKDTVIRAAHFGGERAKDALALFPQSDMRTLLIQLVISASPAPIRRLAAHQSFSHVFCDRPLNFCPVPGTRQPEATRATATHPRAKCTTQLQRGGQTGGNFGHRVNGGAVKSRVTKSRIKSAKFCISGGGTICAGGLSWQFRAANTLSVGKAMRGLIRIISAAGRLSRPRSHHSRSGHPSGHRCRQAGTSAPKGTCQLCALDFGHIQFKQSVRPFNTAAASAEPPPAPGYRQIFVQRQISVTNELPIWASRHLSTDDEISLICRHSAPAFCIQPFNNQARDGCFAKLKRVAVTGTKATRRFQSS
ncbi:MAG: hypothetical protein CM15mP55_0070 [Hyphomicrobiales bacterium]|nr:MAG: hypothetical protein CM15mP55_0070 [Hyphomicrobiales bacterium]